MIVAKVQPMKVAVLGPTTAQLIEKMAALFPQGIDVVGPRGDVRSQFSYLDARPPEWKEVGLDIRVKEMPFAEIDLASYDLVIESAETFLYSVEWQKHWRKIECPTLLKVCWMENASYLPDGYRESRLNFPVLLEMPSHEASWKAAGFKDVNVIPNPVGDWWFQNEWTGKEERVLIVLAGRDIWRGEDPNSLGFDIWRRIEQRFPGKTYHQDAAKAYLTTKQLAELMAESRVFVNLDGLHERPLALVFTEAISAGMPVVARDLPGLNYQNFISTNGVCTNIFDEMCKFISNCLNNLDFARKCSERSREIGKQNFSLESLRPRYTAIIARAMGRFR